MASTDAVRQPWFGGARTLEEQLLGLEPALAEARGKTVLDLGCAEGCISIEFAKAGAALVHAVEVNPETVATARKLCEAVPRVHVMQANLNRGLPPGCLPRYDIVLALACIHKLQDPAQLIAAIARTGAGLVVVRLPGGSAGSFATKHYGTACDLNAEFQANGFSLESVTPGPRGELVQYWRTA